MKILRGQNSEPPLGNYSAPHQIRTSYVSGTKIFLRRYTVIYGHLLSKCFENAVFGRLEMIQPETCLLENLLSN